MTPPVLRGVDPLGRSRSARVITGDRIWTGVAGEVIDRGAVAIEGGSIAWVGPAAELPAQFAAAPRADLTGGTLLPGLIETHAHLESYAKVVEPDVPLPDLHDRPWLAFSSVTIARQLASVGVTTVQSLGSRGFTDVALREAIAVGLIDGPRIVASGPQLTTTAGHAWRTGGEVDSIDEIRRAVRTHHKAGVDLIKVMATGGFFTYGSAPWNAQFTVEELRAIADDAHRLGKHTAAHAHGTQGIARAVEAGIDYLAHASFINEDGVTEFDPRLADAIAEAGVYVDAASPPSHPAVPGETQTPRAAELYAHGVKIVAGHDIGAVRSASGYVDGLEELEKSGLPREEILIAATSRAAAAVGLAGVTGVLHPGYEADLIAVDGDPLADLGALRRLRAVVIRGTEFTPDPPGEDREPPAERGLRAAQAERTAAAERAARHPHR